MTKVEEVALAIVNHESRKLDLPELATVDEFRFDSDRAHYMEIARAAILAMREPSKEMIEPGYVAMDQNVDFYCYDSGSGYSIEPSGPANVWRAMIDAALSE